MLDAMHKYAQKWGAVVSFQMTDYSLWYVFVHDVLQRVALVVVGSKRSDADLIYFTIVASDGMPRSTRCYTKGSRVEDRASWTYSSFDRNEADPYLNSLLATLLHVPDYSQHQRRDAYISSRPMVFPKSTSLP